MAKKRGGRGADLYAARQNENIAPTAEEIDELGGEPDITVLTENGDEIDNEPAEELVVHHDADEPDEDDEEEADDEPDEALTVMQRQLAALQARNAELEKQVGDSEMDVVVSNQAVLTQALNSAKQRALDAEVAIEVASAAGDHKGVAKATAALSKAIQDQDRFELAHDELVAEIEDRKANPPKPAAKQAAADSDPYVDSLKRFSEPSREWLLKHRKSIEGKVEVGEKAQAVAMHAVKVLGIKNDSPEFFAHLDKEMGFAEMPTKRNKPAPGRPQTAAPTGARGGGGKPNEVVLTKAQRDAALQMGIPLKEYAKSVMEIQKNGQDPNRTGLRFSASTAHSARR